MATDLKRLKQHFKAYEPTLKELERKYQVSTCLNGKGADVARGTRHSLGGLTAYLDTYISTPSYMRWRNHFFFYHLSLRQKSC